MKDERRKQERFHIRQMLQVSANGDFSLKVVGLDLSTGGLSCESSEPFEPAAPVSIMLGLPYVTGAHLVSCSGFVAYCRPSGARYVVGIEFTNMHAEDSSLIEEYVSALGSEAR
jgi:hypothetical protein